jgi:GTP-binding protein HflX
LEEVANADLILVVVDASDPAWQDQEKTVSDLLSRLSVEELPRLTAYNKMDCLSAKKRELFGRQEGFRISATTGKGLKELLAAVEHRLSHQWVEKDLLFGYQEGARMAQLHRHMHVLSQKTTSAGIRIRVRAHPNTLAQWLSRNDAGQ